MLLHTIKEVREQISDWKKQGLKIGLVPTMGALHAGHASLIKKAVDTCDKVVVSVFVAFTICVSKLIPTRELCRKTLNLRKV